MSLHKTIFYATLFYCCYTAESMKEEVFFEIIQWWKLESLFRLRLFSYSLQQAVIIKEAKANSWFFPLVTQLAYSVILILKKKEKTYLLFTLWMREPENFDRKKRNLWTNVAQQPSVTQSRALSPQFYCFHAQLICSFENEEWMALDESRRAWH